MAPKPWTIVSSRFDKSYRIFNLRTDSACSPRTNRIHDFFIMESSPWVNIIPLTPKDEVVMVQQYRHGIRSVTLEIPGGLVEPDDSPEEAARRELLEETGYREESMISLSAVHPNPAIQNNICHTFLARNVYPTGTQNQDEREDIEVVVIPLTEIPRLIREGTITHSLVIVAFYRFYIEHLQGFGCLEPFA
jgi:8-oxo-dGTP pyrophosphatase MutT (NUDIX family)